MYACLSFYTRYISLCFDFVINFVVCSFARYLSRYGWLNFLRSFFLYVCQSLFLYVILTFSHILCVSYVFIEFALSFSRSFFLSFGISFFLYVCRSLFISCSFHSVVISFVMSLICLVRSVFIYFVISVSVSPDRSFVRHCFIYFVPYVSMSLSTVGFRYFFL